MGPHAHAEVVEPAGGPLDRVLRVLVGRTGGQHEHLVGVVGGEQVAVEVAAVAPFGAADQGEGPRHGAAQYRPLPEGPQPGRRVTPAPAPGRLTARSGPLLLPVGSVPAHDHHTPGDRWVGDHGIRDRGGGGQGRRRRGAALPPAVERRRDGRLAREVAGQAGRAGQARRAGREGGRRSRDRHRPPRRAPRLRPRARVRRRGPRREEDPVRRARRGRQAGRHPRHQHLDAPGGRAGRGHQAARAGRAASTSSTRPRP